MANKNLTAICMVVDGSGSMSEIKKGVISGINEFIKTQNDMDGKVTFSMIQFSSNFASYPNLNSFRHSHQLQNENLTYNKIYNFIDLKEAKKLTNESYKPSGGTPLLDAMAKAIDEFGADLARIPEKDRPSKVVFVTITDGEENTSTVNTKESLLERIKHQSNKYDWQFVYLGANQDSFAESAQYGYSAKSTSNYNYSDKGFIRAMNAVSNSVGSYRSSVADSVDLSAYQKDLEKTDEQATTK